MLFRSDEDMKQVASSSMSDHLAYPAYGMSCPGESAIAVRHADGNMSLEMEVISINNMKTDNSSTTVISLRDKVYPFYVDVHYKAYNDVDMIETWSEIRHEEKKFITLNQFSSGYLPVRRRKVWISHLYVSWANEGKVTQERLEPGMKIIKNKDGVRNSHTAHSEIMFSLDGKPSENKGRVIGAALCYSGNYKLKIDTDDSEYHHFYAGINEDNSSYNLRKGEVFKTPEIGRAHV